MADRDDIFYGLSRAARAALPSMPSYKNKTVPEIAQDMDDQFRSLLQIARRSVFSRIYFKISDGFLQKRYERELSITSRELAVMNKQAGAPAVYTLNDSYDFFCTSASRIVDGKPVITSALDWGKLPEICKALYHAECEGEQGPYDIYNVVGYAGALRASARGRFAVALNRAPVPSYIFPHLRVASQYPEERWLKAKAQKSKLVFLFNAAAFAISCIRGEALDKFVSTAVSYLSTKISPPFLLREVFETATNFDEAVERIAKEKLSAPALMVLTGVNETENCAIYRTRSKCVIETTEAGYAGLKQKFMFSARIKVMKADKICVANHWPDHVARYLGHGFDRVDNPRERDANMRAQLDNEHIDIKQGIEVDSTVLYSEQCAATGASRAVAIDNRKPVAYHVK